MKLSIGIRIILVGTVIETVGLVADIFHHLNIGIETAEGLLTANHLLIFVGFLIHVVGLLLVISKRT